MSAYGAITRASAPALASTIWSLKPRASPGVSTSDTVDPSLTVTIHHLTLATTPPKLLSYLHEVFAQVLEDGLTYPQEVAEAGQYTQDMFEAYFFAGDVFVAVLGKPECPPRIPPPYTATTKELQGVSVSSVDINADIEGRTLEDCVAGFYYVKPNYPGRSSHICNAGFIVPPPHRNKGIGSILANSYLHYAPQLGYEASVFNLVYVNNVASVRLWENLGFTKAGRIPRAGRLKRRDGDGEEYVDAWVFYKRFLGEEEEEGGVA